MWFKVIFYGKLLKNELHCVYIHCSLIYFEIDAYLIVLKIWYYLWLRLDLVDCSTQGRVTFSVKGTTRANLVFSRELELFERLFRACAIYLFIRIHVSEIYSFYARSRELLRKLSWEAWFVWCSQYSFG